jgi:hypothetical protein
MRVVIRNADDCGFAVVELIDRTESWGSAGNATLQRKYHWHLLGYAEELHFKMTSLFFSAWKSWEDRDIHFGYSYKRNVKALSHFANLGLTGPNQRCLNQVSIQVDSKGSDDVHNTRDYWVFGFCASSRIIKNTAFRKLYFFPSSSEVAGETCSVGSVRMWGQIQFQFPKLRVLCNNERWTKSKKAGNPKPVFSLSGKLSVSIFQFWDYV